MGRQRARVEGSQAYNPLARIRAACSARRGDRLTSTATSFSALASTTLGIGRAEVDASAGASPDLVLAEHFAGMLEDGVGDGRLSLGGGMEGTRVDAGEQQLHPGVALRIEHLLHQRLGDM